MLVTAIVFIALCALANIAMIWVALATGINVASAKGIRAFDRVLRKLKAEEYKRLVALPFVGAIVGGLIATAISILVAYPPWPPNARDYVALALIVIAAILAVAWPILIQVSYSDPKNLGIGEQIDLVKAGAWTQDHRGEILSAIEKDRAAILKKLNSSDRWFFALLTLVALSDLGLLAFDYVKNGLSVRLLVALLVMTVIILCGLGARYKLRPMSLRSDLAELDSYLDEVNSLSAVAASVRRDSANRRDNHSLWIAVGGMRVSVQLARLHAARNRDTRER